MSFRTESKRVFVAGLATLMVAAVTALVPNAPAFADDNAATEGLTTTCDVVPAGTPVGIDQSGVQGAVPGEVIAFRDTITFAEGEVYQDILTRPDGSTYWASYMELTSLPSDLVLDPDSVNLEIEGTDITLVAGTEPDPDDFVLEEDTTTPGQVTWRVLFPGDVAAMTAAQTGFGEVSYSVPAGGETFVLSFETLLPTDATWGEVFEGSECFNSISTGPSNRDTDRVRAAVSAILPEIELTKNTSPDNVYLPYAPVSYTLVATVPEVDLATQTLVVAPARDVVITDNVPDELVPVDANLDPVADGGTTFGGGIWTEATRTVVYPAFDLMPGNSAEIDEVMRVALGTPASTNIVNEIVADISYLPGTTNPNDTVVLDADNDDALVTVGSPAPSVSKTSGVDRYGTGLPIPFTVVVDIPAGASFENFTIVDTLPDGMSFVSYDSATCTPAGPTCPDPIATLTPTAFPGGGAGIGWYPNTIDADLAPRQMTFVYSVQIDPTYGSGDPVEFLDSFANDVSVNWNTVDRLGDIEPSTASLPPYDGSVDATDTVIFDRPILTVDKRGLTSDGDFSDTEVTDWDFQPGDTVDYTTTVTNTGSRPAQNLSITDVVVGVGIDVATVLIDGGPCGDCAIDGDGVLSFTYAGPVAQGDSFDVTYQATATATGVVSNTFSIPAYSDDLGSTYTEQPADTVEYELPDPVLRIDKLRTDTLDYANSVGTQVPFRFRVRNVGTATAYNIVVTDVPPTGFCNVDGGLDAGATGVTETAAGVWQLDSPLAGGDEFSFDAVIEICDPVDPGNYENVAELRWEDTADNLDADGDAYYDEDPADVDLIPPVFEVIKAPFVDDGATLNWTTDTANPSEGAWTITVVNRGDVPIGGLVVNDPMPDPFEYFPGDATIVWVGQSPSTMVDNSVADPGAILAGHTPNVSLTLGQLEPGAQARITVPFAHNGETPSDGQFTRLNTVTVTNPGIDFDADSHQADGEYTLVPIEPGPSVDKTVSNDGSSPGAEIAESAPGGVVTFTIDLTIDGDPANPADPLTSHDVLLVDTLPDGLVLGAEPTYGEEGTSGSLPAGWTVSCVAGPCSAEFTGAYLGTSLNVQGRTVLHWWFGDYADAADSTYRVTFPATVDTTYSTGVEVIDGIGEPMINSVRPFFNRDVDAGVGASGDVFPGLPASIPDSGTEFDRAFPKDRASVDIVTPRLDIEKQGFDSDGNPVFEVEAGEVIDYRITITNVGSGPAFDIDLIDDLAVDLGVNRMDIDETSVLVSPAGVACAIVGTPQELQCEFAGPLAGDPDGFTGPGVGGQIVIEYQATPLVSPDMLSPISALNNAPDVIRNEVQATEYYEVAGPDHTGDTVYSTGNAVVRTFVFTPVPEVEVACANEMWLEPIGGTALWSVRVSNGDIIGGTDYDSDIRLEPSPTLDLDGDGRLDHAVGYSPELIVTLPDFDIVGYAATGRGPLTNDPDHDAMVAFPDPDVIVDNGDGTQTLTWNRGSIPDVAYIPNANYSTGVEYYIEIETVMNDTGPFRIDGQLSFLDGSGATERGQNSGEPYEYLETDTQGCPNPGDNRVHKTPDAEDNVAGRPGEIDEFTIRLENFYLDDHDVVNNRFVDLLPHGLEYRGLLDPADPDYAVATIVDAPPTWPAGAELEDYFVSATVLPDGETEIIWDNVPPIPSGNWYLKIPVRYADVPPFPNDFLTNNFEWHSDDGLRGDAGDLYSMSADTPTLEKRVDHPVDAFGSTFAYTVEVTIPAGFSSKDVVIRDWINRRSGWSQAEYTYDNATMLPNGGLDKNNDLPPVEFLTYVSETCIVGCTTAADTITPVGLAPLPLVEYGDPADGPVSAYNDDDNNAIGWYLGDIDPDPEGQDRVLQLTYAVQMPTLDEFREIVADRRPTTFPGGATDPLFDEDPTWLLRLAEMHRPNLAILDGGYTGDNTWWDTNDGSTNTDWWNQVTGIHAAADEQEAIISYPVVTMDKQCGAPGSELDAQPIVTAIGTPNVECTITVTNESPVDAYDVIVDDTPMTDCVYALRHLNGTTYWRTAATGGGHAGTDFEDPDIAHYDCDISSISLNHPNLSTPVNSLPAQWVLELEPNQVVELSYALRIDGWSNYAGSNHWRDSGDWETRGAWRNDARLAPWSDTPGGETIGAEVTAWEQVNFKEPYLDINKFPFPVGRDVASIEADASPFIQYNDPAECYLQTTWPYRHGPGCREDRTSFDANFQDPLNAWDVYGGDYWTEGDDATDVLDPVERRLTRFVHPIEVRARQLGVRGNGNCGGWNDNNQCWDPFDTTTDNQGWWSDSSYGTPSLAQQENWAEIFDVVPGQPYRWSLDIRADELSRLESMSITDQLPYGWTYVTGSAEILDGNWFLSHDGPGTFDSEIDNFETNYGAVPLPDPVIDGSTQGDCHAEHYHEDGPTMTWTFQRDVPGNDQPWEYRYVDARTWDYEHSTPERSYDQGEFDKYNWIRIHYEATPDPSILACDPDDTSTDKWFMENNVTLEAVRDYDAVVLTQPYNAIVPVPTPVALSKTPDDDYVTDDTLTEFTITFTNDLDVPVTDITLTDNLTITGGVPLGTGYTCGTASTPDGTGFAETRCDQTPTTSSVDWFFSSIAPGESVVITMPIQVPADENNNTRYDNTVTTTVKEYFDTELTDAGRITVINPSEPPTPSKGSTPNPATINDVVEYTVSWTANATQIFADLAYIDTLPDGLTFIEYTDITCDGSCPSGYDPADVVTYTPVPNGDGTTTLMWWFGDMPGSGASHTWSMSYRVRVNDEFVVPAVETIEDGDSVTNTVVGYSNEEDLLDEPAMIPPPSTWTTYPPSDPGSETVDIREPELAIAKTATPSSTPVDGSSTIAYTVEVTNTGVMNAYGVQVSDTPNGALENIVMDPTTFPGSVVTRGWTSIDPTVGWFIPAIAPGETATFTYTAEVADDFLISGYGDAENEAAITEFRARPGVEPEPGDRIYEPILVATTTDPLVGPRIRLEKFVGGCADEFQFVDPDTPVTWCIQVINDGEAPAYGAVVRDTLPFRWEYDAGSTAADGWTAVEPTVGTLATDVQTLEWTIGDVAAGETKEIQFTAQADPAAPLNVTNRAAVETFTAGGGTLPASLDGARDSDIARAATGGHGLEIAKVPDEQQGGWEAGEKATWDLVITNPSSDTTNNNLVVTDFLPAPLTYDTWNSTDGRVTLDTAGAVGAGPGGTQEIVWNISSLGPNETITIELIADVPATFVEMQWYVNDVQVVSDEVTDLVVNQAKGRWYEAASLGDYTWIDADADGVQDPGEDAIDGVTVNLLDGSGNQLYRDPASGAITTNPALGYPAMTTTTGDDPSTTGTVEEGWYEFGDLPAGDYMVEFVEPPGYVLTFNDLGGDDAEDSDADRATGQSHVVSLDPGEHDPTIDAGFIPGAVNEIGDYTWIDTDRDGVQDAGEDGIDGVIVDLIGPGPDGIFGTADDVVLATTTTGDDPSTPAVEEGWYEFTGLPDGEYVVEFRLDPTNPDHDGYDFTFADQGGDDAADSDADRLTGQSGVIDLDSAGVDDDPVVDPTIDAGFFQGGDNSLGDYTWIDADMDGVQDADEDELPGVLVDLIGAGPDGIFGTADDVVLQSTATDASGFYEFTNLPDGEYQVEFSLDATNPAHDGLAPTFADQGADDAADSDADRVTGRSHTIDLDSAGVNDDPVVDPTIDAGYFPGGVNELGDHTWIDLDADGVQDVGEPVLPGVIVTLYGPGPDGVFGGADDVALQTTTTDASGYYEFTELPDGEYVVGFELDPTNPAHDDLGPTWPNQGGDDAADSDADRATGLSPVVDLDSAGVDDDPVVDPTIDAGYIPNAVNIVGDYTWLDADMDGVQDVGEDELPGVLVDLIGAGPDGVFGTADDIVLASTTTDATGWYEFADLPDGEYQVEFSLDPANPAHDDLVATWEHQGGDDAADSDANRQTGRSHTVDLDSAGVDDDPVVDPTVDAGFFEDADAVNEIGDFTWLDADNDGVQDPGEAPLEGVIVTLYGPGPDGIAGNGDDIVIATTTTDATGAYEFTNLPDGEYVVGFELDPTNPDHDGLDFTFDNQGGDDAADSDADRTTGLSQVIDLDSAGADDDPVVDATIDAGFVDSDANELGDFVWIDADQDGVQDALEDPVEGALVDLIGAGPDGVFGTADDVVLDSTTTDSSGFYEFTDLPDGEYQVEFNLDSTNPDHDDLVPTWEHQGGDDAADSDANRQSGRSHTVDLDSAGADDDPVIDPTIDAGFFDGADAVNAIGDHVWIDADGDGVQDAGESGLSGVIVTLYDPGPDGVPGGGDDVAIATTTTDADGAYEFTNLPDGEYVVGFETDPANPAHNGLDLTFENQGGDDAADSDADRLTGLTDLIDLDSDGTDDDPVIDLTIDAGYILTGDNSLGDYAFIDVNQDGVQDGGDTPLEGVIVDLYGAGADGVFGTADDVFLQSTTTDAAGFYEFTDLPDGEYQVEFSLDPANPAHDDLVPTWEHQGGDDAADSDANRQSGRSHTVDLDSAGVDDDPVNDPTIDAGWFDDADAVNEIGDFTWLDADNDGVQDPGEAPLEGVIVSLYGPGPDGVFGGADDVVLATTTTDATGFYEFTNLPDGEYVVGFELDPTNPAHDGLDFTFDNQGGDDAADSDADRTTGLTAVIDLDSAGASADPIVDATIDAGFVEAQNSLGDSTFIDVNQDGVQDAGDTPLAGVIVELMSAGPDGVFGTADDAVLDTTTTDASGSYEFVDLPDGEYQVAFSLDPANPAHDDLVPTWEHQGGDDAADSDANRQTGRSHTVDLDSAGVDNDPVNDPTIDAGWLDDADAVNEIGNYTWLDTDRDGIPDVGEPPLEGVIVTLYGPGPDGIAGNGDDVALATTTTDASGFYEFTNLPDGEYVVGFELDPTNPDHDDLGFTWADQGTDDSIDSDADRVTGLTHVIDLDSDGTSTDPIVDPTIDAGFVEPIGINSIGDYTWIDADRDGAQDPGEVPVEGVLVSLIGAGPDGVFGNGDDIVLQVVSTDATGWYEFADLPDGEYQVEFNLEPTNPAHATLIPTWENTTTDETDSDANRQNGRTHVIDLDSAGTSADPIVDSTVDAGYIDDPSAINRIGDTTWIDSDGDGVQDPGELPLAGVLIELIDPVTGQVIATTVSDVDGFYEFSNLPDGEYIVRFTLDPDNPTHAPLAPTPANEGADDEDDSDADPFTGMTGIISLDPNGVIDTAVEDLSVEAGFTSSASIGDTVWRDSDTDGQQDDGEPGIPDVTVELWSPGPDGEFGGDDDVLVSSTSTDADGNYLFDDLPPGEYRVRFDPSTLPPGYTPTTTPSDCGCPGTDSDGGADGWTSSINLTSGEDRDDIDWGAYTDGDLAANGPSGPLAFTGREALDLGSLAAVLLTVGFLLVFASRRARREDELAA